MIRAHFSRTGCIIFTTSPDCNAITFDNTTTILAATLEPLGWGTPNMIIGQKTTQYMVHGVPVTANLETCRYEIEAAHPAVKLGLNPRWLIPEDRRRQKLASTIVVSMLGTIPPSQLGTKHIYIANRICKIEPYISFNETTQCRTCMRYGHPTARCKEQPTCGVCAEQHPTQDHPCSVLKCPKGGKCTHPPVKCINCDQPHKATDPNCPTRAKLRNRNPTAPVSMEEEL